SYWNAADHAAEAHIDAADARAEIHRLAAQAVADRMIADVPLGGFLSGGVDSSLVCALMQKASMARVKTFTIGFEEEAYNEAPHAKEVAQHLGTEHTELMVGEADVLDLVSSLPATLDEPFADSSLLPTYLVSALTRRSVTVSLSGDGGDELFAGYQRYRWTQQMAQRIFSTPRWLRHKTADLAESQDLRRLIGGLPTPSFLGRPAPIGAKMQRLAEVLRVESADELFAQTVTHWSQPHLTVLNSQERSTVYDDPAHWSSTLAPPRSWAARDLVAYLPNDCLTKVDRASMQASLEARVPLLDHRLVEFCLGLSGEVLCPDNRPKGVLKDILTGYLPQAMINRPKRGFAVPLGSWLKGPLKEWAASYLDEVRLRNEGFFDTAVITRMWNQHVNGQGDWSAYLWDVLMFQVWLNERSG
ncbi:MAG: asparagine synthase C-terminal domain-containing protein, partial [Proteobacteria bacterium]|nr:asparagine synthase C-terminal domain-containing protein [Pseudomonadota bacterium]